MDRLTPLDRAFAATEGGGDAAVARFYALLVETPLFIPIEPRDDDAPIAPRTFPLEGGDVALAFDDDARMTDFFEGPVEYVTLSGRAIIGALTDAGLGLGLNLGDFPSAQVLAADTIRWIRDEMGGDVAAMDLSGAVTVAPPTAPPRALLTALADRVGQLPGILREAWLVDLDAEGGTRATTLLLLPGSAARRAMPGVVAMLGRVAAVHGDAESGVSIGVLDDGHALLDPARRHGHALHPPPESANPSAPPKPDGPPRLR
jgi:hypothetical protein